MDKLTKEQRRKNMQAVKSHDSKIEIALSKELWKRGYRYRKNDKTVFGKPDLTFKKYKLAIFVDSEFWHSKIERNIERDKEVNKYLTVNGWKVLRFWGKEIQNNLITCITKIEQEIAKIKNEI